MTQKNTFFKSSPQKGFSFEVCFVFFITFILSSCVWTSPEDNPDFLPLDDSEYPYAELPRIVIETKDFAQIRDKETKHPAHLQIWGKNSPISEVLNLTVKGRGNSSLGMSKYSLKLKFDEKISLLGMPKDKEWALVSNHADKSLLRNYSTMNLARQFNMDYVPRAEFAEVYFNREYMGLYLVMENIKVSKNRVNIPKDENHFLIEVDAYYDKNDQIVKTTSNLPLKIHSPKEISDSSKNAIKNHIDAWENFIKTSFSYDTLVNKWININNYTTYYWIEELAKNVDSNLKTSVYFTWEKGGKIKMGPLWDFDLSYGEYKMYSPKDWYSRWGPWNKYLIKNDSFKKELKNFWKENHETFLAYTDSIEVYYSTIEKAAKNNFKRWPVLGTTFLWEFNQSYHTHREAVDSLKSWINQRVLWIDNGV